MYRFLVGILFMLVVQSGAAQRVKDMLPYTQYADFHIHPTYKHYFRPRTADSMKLILRSTTYNRQTDRISFTPAVVELFKNVNWTKYADEDEVSLKNGLTSDLRNYDQAAYPEIMYVPGSLFCNSYSPYEKQFALKHSKRWISSKIVTKMGLKRLEAYAENDHTPLGDFLAEYYFNLMQEEEKLVEISLPAHLYAADGKNYTGPFRYYDRIKMVKDAAELDAILQQNEKVFASVYDSKSPPHIITPMVMSIEGAQVLYDTLSGRADNILRSFCDTCANRNAINAELLKSVDSLKNLHHRLFFITLGHFAQNHVVGYAKTLDRDPQNFQHRALAAVTKIPKIRNDVLFKTYAGFNMVDSIGFKVVEAFLDPTNNRYKKPTYIDVKHMDIKGRLQYYSMRRKYEKKFNIHIPIIASHFAVSGESQAMAAATGLWPNFDRYPENEDAKKYYYHQILRGEDAKTRLKWWRDIMRANNYPGADSLNDFERRMYRPLQFTDVDTMFVQAYDPFEKYVLKDNKEVGWFYPWSINLFDEEIIEIAKSDGIIGLLMDPRQHGAFMGNYTKKYRAQTSGSFNRLLPQLTREDFALAGLQSGDIFEKEYVQVEPILRNIFYIIRLLRKQEAAENYFKTASPLDIDTLHKRFPFFVPDEEYLKRKAWNMIAIGSDYDGLIDPVDVAPTAAYIPFLHQKFIIYAYIFANIHTDEFSDPITGEPMIKTIKESKEKMEGFFYENGKNFIRKYF